MNYYNFSCDTINLHTPPPTDTSGRITRQHIWAPLMTSHVQIDYGFEKFDELLLQSIVRGN